MCRWFRLSGHRRLVLRQLPIGSRSLPRLVDEDSRYIVLLGMEDLDGQQHGIVHRVPQTTVIHLFDNVSVAIISLSYLYDESAIGSRRYTGITAETLQ